MYAFVRTPAGFAVPHVDPFAAPQKTLKRNRPNGNVPSEIVGGLGWTPSTEPSALPSGLGTIRFW
jgi:hypothetical protein